MNEQIKQTNKQDSWASSDLYIVASILTTKKADLLDSNVVIPNKVMEFVLSNPSECQKLQDDFINERLTLDAKSFSDNIKMLLSLRREF